MWLLFAFLWPRSWCSFGFGFGRRDMATLLLAGVDTFPRLDEGTNKANVLTSRPLERIRIQRQLDADEQYQELADPQELPTTERLAAVMTIIDTFASMRPAIERGEYASVAEALTNAPFEKKAFKRTFNAYSDNIYYSNPDRANVYLLGGTPPSNKQTIQYLYRNQALDNIEQLRSELEYLATSDDNDASDALRYHDDASKALSDYLLLVPEDERQAARQALSSSNRSGGSPRKSS